MSKHIYQLFLSLCFIVIGQVIQAQELQQLEPNKPVEREIAGGQEHTYQIKLTAKQFARVVAEQKGINIALAFSDPDGKKLVETDLTPAFIQESLSRETAVSGLYQLKVSVVRAAALTGTYHLQLEIHPTATAADVQRSNAEQLLIEAKPLANKGGADSEQAVEKYQKALLIWRELPDRYWEAQTLIFLGRAYQRLSQNDKALEYSKQALALNIEIKNKAGESNALNDIGSTFYRMNRFEPALENFQKMLVIKREIKDRENEGGALLNIGAVYNSSGNQEKSIEHYEQALKIMREVKNRNSEGFILTGIGNIHLARNDYQKALEYHQQSLEIYRDVKDRLTEGLALNNIGLVYKAFSRK
jgi:tetratricopeptide (TPR) repeat protein